MATINHRYVINESLINELTQAFSNNNVIYRKGYETIPLIFYQIKIYDSNKLHLRDNLPAFYIEFKKKRSKTLDTVGNKIQNILKYFIGFTDEQVSIIQRISNECTKQDEVFLEENKLNQINETNAQLEARKQQAERDALTREKYEAIRKQEELQDINKVDTEDESGRRLTKADWEELYERAITDFPRSDHESRAIVYNHILYPNASRALIANEMDPKRGDELYKACEKGKMYMRHPCYYASPYQIRSYIDIIFSTLEE